MRVLVFGAGSIGSFIGGMVADEHDVTLIGREPHVSTVASSGLRIPGELEHASRPTAKTTISEYTGDVGIVTVKAYDTPAAAQTLERCELDCVVSLQNGMGNESVLASHLDTSVVGGTVTYGAVLRDPGVVECTGVGSITLGSYAGSARFADTARDVFVSGGLACSVTDDIEGMLWEKLAVNAGINPVTALARVNNGALVESSLRDVALAASRETAGVARSHGISLPDSTVEDRLREVVVQTASNESSMYRDIAQGRRTEIDAINGYVVENATEPVPTNQVLTSLVTGWETAHSLR